MKPTAIVGKGETPMADDRYLIQTLALGLKLLDILAWHPNSSLGEIANKAALGTTQTFRLLHTLERSGYVEKSETKTYRLGTYCLTLGYAAHRNHPLIAQSRDVLDNLVEQSGESSHLVIRHGLTRVIADMRDSPQRVRASAPLGQVDPLYCGGTGLAILAFSPPELVDAVLSRPLEPLTSKTITDPGKVRAVLAEVRQNGYHVAREDFKVGAFSIAAPVFEGKGTCNASICIAGPMSRLTDASFSRYIETVIEAASEISQRLGYSSHHMVGT
jgi:IclR family KDG regulon transcriptional repressor